MRIAFLLVCITLPLVSGGQYEFGIKGAAGLSHISDAREDKDPRLILNPTFAPSASLGIFYEKKLINKYGLGVGLNLNQINGNLETLFRQDEPITVLAFTSYYSYLTYLSLPIYAQRSFKNFSFNAGIRPSVLVRNGDVRTIGHLEDGAGNIIAKTNVSYGPAVVKNFDFGIQAGATYHLTSRIEVELTLYQGVQNIFDGYGNRRWNISQVLLGPCFTLHNKE